MDFIADLPCVEVLQHVVFDRADAPHGAGDVVVGVHDRSAKADGKARLRYFVGILFLDDVIFAVKFDACGGDITDDRKTALSR